MKKKYGVILTAMLFAIVCFALSACIFKHTHTPNEDNDSDCSTPVKCSTCHAVMPAKVHVADTNWSYDNRSHYTVCTNENCTIVLGEQTNHIQKNGANDCECGYVVDSNMFTIRDGYLSYCNPREYTSITIPEGVIRVGEQAFRDCKNITSVTIPSSVKIISYQAFYDCISLTNIMMPSSVIRIGEQAFYGCTSLTSITIPKGVTSIDATAFSRCTNLASITVEEGNTKYHSAGNSIIETATKTLFLGCKNSSIPTDGSVTSIGNYAFSNCTSLTSITIPEGVTTIDNYAFEYCTSLASITIPESVTSIYNYAFSNCTSLASITIPESVTSIYNSAFSNCTSLATITIPEGVKEINSSAFSNCTSLESITIPEGVKEINSSAFENCSSLISITIPESVRFIGGTAFGNCTSLTSITIPESVKYIDWWAFYGCNGLMIYAEASAKPSGWASNWNLSNCPIVWDYKNNDVAEDGNIYYVAENGIRYALKNNVATVVGQSTRLSGAIEIPSTVLYKSNSYNVTSIGRKAFYNCRGITIITIPESVTIIGEDAFYGCSSLASITIGNSVTSIGSTAFYCCSSLASITIGNSVTSIGSTAFYGCSGLTVYAEASVIPSGWASNWNSSCPVVWDYKNNDVAEDGNIYYIAENGIRYTLKNNVATVVGQSTRLSGAIEIPSTILYKSNSYNVTSIGRKAFYNCRGITIITIPESVTIIGYEAFYKCTRLASITIPESVTTISDYALNGCSGLTSITYTGTTADWNAIRKGSYWNGSTGNYTITCTDGTLTK